MKLTSFIPYYSYSSSRSIILRIAWCILRDKVSAYPATQTQRDVKRRCLNDTGLNLGLICNSVGNLVPENQISFLGLTLVADLVPEDF